MYFHLLKQWHCIKLWFSVRGTVVMRSCYRNWVVLAESKRLTHLSRKALCLGNEFPRCHSRQWFTEGGCQLMRVMYLTNINLTRCQRLWIQYSGSASHHETVFPHLHAVQTGISEVHATAAAHDTHGRTENHLSSCMQLLLLLKDTHKHTQLLFFRCQ